MNCFSQTCNKKNLMHKFTCTINVLYYHRTSRKNFDAIKNLWDPLNSSSSLPLILARDEGIEPSIEKEKLKLTTKPF